MVVAALVTVLFIPVFSVSHGDALLQDAVSPEGRGGHAMVYDPHNDVSVLFGGMTMDGGLHALGDTWFYDTPTNTWTRHTATPSPPSRNNLAMTYCNQTKEIIMYGGGQATDTWSFDCATQTWSQVVTTSNPGIHHSHGMAYDPQENAVILFGGFGSDGYVTDDTWKFDCVTREWTNLAPSTTPLARYGHVMVYDESINQIVLTSGNTAYEGHQDDTWTFDVATNTWNEVTTIGNPDALKWPSMTYDSVDQKCILFGGQVGDTLWDRTWIYDAQSRTWTNANPVDHPSGRINTALAFDSSSNLTVLFGGWLMEAGQVGDTWTYSYGANNWASGGTEPAITDSTSTTTTSTSGEPSEIPLELVVVSVGIVGVIVVIIFVRKRI